MNLKGQRLSRAVECMHETIMNASATRTHHLTRSDLPSTKTSIQRTEEGEIYKDSVLRKAETRFDMSSTRYSYR